MALLRALRHDSKVAACTHFKARATIATNAHTHIDVHVTALPLQMYMKVLVNCLKRGEPATRTAASPWKPYYQAFKTTLEDYDVSGGSYC